MDDVQFARLLFRASPDVHAAGLPAGVVPEAQPAGGGIQTVLRYKREGPSASTGFACPGCDDSPLAIDYHLQMKSKRIAPLPCLEIHWEVNAD